MGFSKLLLVVVLVISFCWQKPGLLHKHHHFRLAEEDVDPPPEPASIDRLICSSDLFKEHCQRLIC